MEFRIRTWTQLGLGAALAAGSLAACGQPAPQEPSAAPEVSAPAGEAPAPAEAPAEEPALGAMGGEGEGGVAIEVAASDPVVYNVALAVAEAHVRAARDAYAAGEKDAAAEMFAHPVSEVLFDMEPVLQGQGVEDFTGLFTGASAAVYAGESQDDISARTEDILSALQAASLKAPDNGTSEAEIALGVCADMIDRAVKMYRNASESEFYEPYLDGYGFYRTAEATFAQSGTAIEAEHGEAAGAIGEALALLAAAYPTATRPDALDADQSALTVAASNVMLDLAD